MLYFYGGVSYLVAIYTGYHLRLFIGGHLPDVSEDDVGVEVPLDVCLLEGLDLGTEDVVETEEMSPCLEV